MSVMPGALIIESMAQSAGTLVMYSLKKKSKNTKQNKTAKKIGKNKK